MTAEPRSTIRAGTDGQAARTAASSALLAIHQAAGVLVPIAAGAAVDVAVAGGDLTALAGWSGALVLLFAAIVLAGSFGGWLNFAAELTAAHRLLVRVVGAILSAPRAADHRAGELSALVARDARQVALVNRAFGTAVPALCALVLGFCALLWTSPPLAAVVAGGVAAATLLSRLMARLLIRRVELERASLVDAGSTAVDLLDGVRVLKGLHAVDAATDRYRLVSDRSAEDRIAAVRWEGRHTAATVAVSGAVLVAVAWLGGAAVLAGSATAGGLVAAIGTTQTVTAALTRLTEIGPLLVRAVAAHREIERITPETQVADDRPALPPAPAHAVRFRGLHLATGALDLTLPAGTCTGLVCPDTRDRDALVAALAGEADYHGAILVGGAQLSGLNRESARAAVLVSGPGADLLPGTLRDNIAAAGPANVDAAVLAAGVDEIARGLPARLDTPVTERGRSLSGGQRQRVALARALAADPPVLVLCDPLSAVDAVTEQHVARGTRLLRGGRTTLLVTSSPALLAECDRVGLLVDGVLTLGTHTGLSTDPRYAAAVFT